MKKFGFKLSHQDKTTKARIGEITTPHGFIHTPAYVPCGTQATVKSLTPDEIKTVGTELFFVNTYHIMLRPGIEIINKSGGLHQFMNWQGPIITDSGGFQVFSLSRKKFGNQIKKIATPSSDWVRNDKVVEPIIVKISDEGVKFQSHWDGSTQFLTPEKSMQLQWQMGSDIHIAFDDCTPYPVTYKQAEKSLERTHKWAIRSLKQNEKCKSQNVKLNIPFPALYGVVQGSIYKDLREKSADFISKMDFDGIAIGGVSVGESKMQMKQVCDWVIPKLPVNKPRHLLGVGEIDDIFEIIERGIDTFDCVQPTRLGRMGHVLVENNQIYTNKYQLFNNPLKRFELDLTSNKFADQIEPINLNCNCYTCQHFTRAYLHHLFKVRELLAYRLATIHNLYFVIDLVAQIRENIKTNTFLQFKKNYLK